MELPSALRQAVDAALAGQSPGELARAAQDLSARYRAEVKDGRFHVEADLAALAYLAVRLPATFAAVRAAMEFAGEMRPNWAPESQLDVGSGPGTAIWAAQSRWPSLSRLTAVEASAAMRRVGEKLGGAGPAWLELDLNGGLPGVGPHDLVTAAYVLNELSPEQQAVLVDRLWALTADTLLLVEPGTPAGWQRIRAARTRLIGAGANLLAPCPHAHACPLAAPDWCHFSRRVARTRIHQLVKDAELAWEDEKYIYLAAARAPSPVFPAPRVLSPPKHGSGRVALKLCQPSGAAEQRLVTKREGDLFRSARRVDWGDRLG